MTFFSTHPRAGTTGWSPARWRVILFVGIAFVFVIWAASVLHAHRAVVSGVAGTYGMLFGDIDRAGRLAVRRVESGSPFERAGVRAGDRVRFDHRGDVRRNVGTDERIGATWYPADGSAGRALVIAPMPDPEVSAHPSTALVNVVLDRTFTLLSLLSRRSSTR